MNTFFTPQTRTWSHPLCHPLSRLDDTAYLPLWLELWLDDLDRAFTRFGNGLSPIKFALQAMMVSVMMVVATASPVHAERIKDMASFAGIRDNQLVGYGVVVGLDGSGDGNLQYTLQSMKSLISRFGVVMPEGVTPGLKNAAAVMLTATLPPFAKPGQRIDVTVSTVGGAKSLRGGTLLMAPLLGADGEVYGMAQGNLAVGGLGIQAADGSKLTVNVPTVGRIPAGATVERRLRSPFETEPYLVLNMNTSDFTTVRRVTEAVNKTLGEGTAVAMDGVSVRVTAPASLQQKVAFMSVLENIEVQAAEPRARVIVNSRTGTIVIGSSVRVTPAAVSHGNLTVRISEDKLISQPSPFADVGQTKEVADSKIDVDEEPVRMFVFDPGTELSSIVDAINAVGASSGDLVAILEALRQAGSLRADLIVI